MADCESRQRDVLPLPCLDKHMFSHKHVSRSICRRLSRKNKSVEWINDGISGLNRLGGVAKLLILLSGGKLDLK